MSVNPYRGLPDRQFWGRAMTAPAPGHVDPVVQSARLEPHQRIATMGSCFAQRLARHIAASGLHHFDAEAPSSGLPAGLAAAQGYGMFSARYGNVYTVRQAVQLFDRAFGTFSPEEDVWERDGRYIDAFRPLVDPQGSDGPGQVRAAAQEHLACVREVFTRFDWLVFTLGLTEAWRSRLDGAVYPLAPGVAGGSFDPDRHEFVNFSAAQVEEDLHSLVARIAGVNPQGRILLTVSPVPMIATCEPQQVWVANTVTKARLRVAADEVERAHPHVLYFPAYEIITSPTAGGRYYAEDLRQVTDAGLRQVMRIFSRHFIEGQAPPVDASLASSNLARASLFSDVVCDEEMIEASLRSPGP